MKIYPDAAMKFLDAGIARTPASRRVYKQTILQLQSMFPGLELEDLSTAHLTQFCMAGQTAPATIRGKKARIRGFVQWCRFHRLIAEDVSADLKYTVRVKAGGVRQHRWLTEQEVARLLRSQPETFEGMRATVALMFGLLVGLRRFEITGLRWSDFTPDYARVTVVGKGDKLVVLGVPPQLRALLAEWHRLAPEGAEVVLPGCPTNQPVDWWTPLSSHRLWQLVHDAGARAGMPELAPHDLRRTYAGILETKGLPIREIQKLLRHESLNTTAVYLEQNPRKLAALADSFTLDL